ncbi:MAG: hypothetical protein WC843_02025 [Candidatus Gracilibacteria bacterium]|jgi:hypothetical protein
MPDEEKRKEPETVDEAAKWVVDLFDQANTGGAIENMGSRGQEVSNAIDDLRRALNRDGKKTVIDDQQMVEIKADRNKTKERVKNLYKKNKDHF